MYLFVFVFLVLVGSEIIVYTVCIVICKGTYVLACGGLKYLALIAAVREILFACHNGLKL